MGGKYAQNNPEILEKILEDLKLEKTPSAESCYLHAISSGDIPTSVDYSNTVSASESGNF